MMPEFAGLVDGMIRIGLTGSIGMGNVCGVGHVPPRWRSHFLLPMLKCINCRGREARWCRALKRASPDQPGPMGVDSAENSGRWSSANRRNSKRWSVSFIPAVYQSRKAFLQRHRARALVVLDIPLLFEKRRARHGAKQVDVTVVVSAPVWMQTKRVLARPGNVGRAVEAYPSPASARSCQAPAGGSCHSNGLP